MKDDIYDIAMNLPPGKTCRDCANGPVCDQLFGAMRRGFTRCDFYPSHYREAATKEDEK